MKISVLCIVLVVLLEQDFHRGGIFSHGETVPLDDSIQNYQVVQIRQLDGKSRWRRSLSTLSTISSKTGHHDRVTFSVDGFGRRFVLNLSLNRLLLPAGSTTRYTNDDGIERSLPSKSIDNCYYNGNIEGVEGSSVALSTCQGIEGLIFDGQESYYVQPHTHLSSKMTTNSHIMYRMNDLKLRESVCDQENHANYSNHIHNKKRVRRSLESEAKYIEMVMVNDYSQFIHFKKDGASEAEALQKTIQRSRKIANLVDSLYRSMNIRVALIELIIWNKKDPIYVDPDSGEALDNFLKWRNNDLIQRRKFKHDNAQLLTHIDFNGPTVGKAQVLAICTSRSAGVVEDHSSNAAATAATLAHELGHNLGMGHDNKKECKCDAKLENQDCIMSGVARSVSATDWSSCSRKEFTEMLDKGIDSCLFNQPKKLYGDAMCGNGFKEEGEDCDCGTPQDCVKYGDNCCNATTCKLLPHAECDVGPCCDKCKLRSSREICRDKVTECDLPEHCTGNSGLCPDNRYVYNGKSCSGGKGYCNGGICPTLNGQCQILWGDQVKSGPELCYTLNMEGNYRGNCLRFPNGTYGKCLYKDIYCGMLHCANTDTDLPIIGTDRNAYKHKWIIKGKTIECRSASLSFGVDVNDPGYAREGTKCATNKVCVSSQCVNITTLLEQNAKCPDDCSNNGICDNTGTCFCDDCWKGSDCSTSTPCLRGGAAGHSKLAGYLILVVLIISLLVAAVAAFVHRDKLKKKWQERKSARQRRYESTQAASPEAKPHKTQLSSITTTTPKPQPMAYPSKHRQPGKIELPSWPSDNDNTSQDISHVPRRPPPGPPPNSNRVSSPPPTGGVSNSPFLTSRPDSYAGVIDRTPKYTQQPQKAVLPPVRAAQSADAIVKPSDLIKAKNNPPTPPKPSQPPVAHRPGRLPPPPPKRPTPP